MCAVTAFPLILEPDVPRAGGHPPPARACLAQSRAVRRWQRAMPTTREVSAFLVIAANRHGLMAAGIQPLSCRESWAVACLLGTKWRCLRQRDQASLFARPSEV